MRIRKRFPPSDHQLHPSAAAQHSDQQSDSLKQPSDQNMAIGYKNSRWALPKNIAFEEKWKLKELERDEPQREEEKKSNDIRKIVNVLDEEEGTDILLQSSSSSAQGRWCEGDNEVVFLKKRKGNFKRNPNQETRNAKVKSKTNQKCVQLNGDTLQILEQKTVKEENGITNFLGGTKKSKRGDEIKEGSRCSRVNGRGWRCCQRTLVGYSLCEHHLGKGRLRSIAGVRRHVVAANGIAPLPNASVASPLRDRNFRQNQPLMVKKEEIKGWCGES